MARAARRRRLVVQHKARSLNICICFSGQDSVDVYFVDKGLLWPLEKVDIISAKITGKRSSFS